MRQALGVLIGICALLVVALPAWASGGSPTLDAVRERGAVRCGIVGGEVAGFAERDGDGAWRGFHVDYCRAVAAAVLGQGDAVEIVALGEAPVPAHLLTAGEVDLLAGRIAWTFRRDLAAGVDFAAVTFFDGQGFMVPRALGVRSAFELDGARVCAVQGSTSALALVDFFETNSMDAAVALVGDAAALRGAYERGACDAVTGDLSRLAVARAKLAEPASHVLLPDIVARAPLALAVRDDDPRWADVVRWVHHALLTAEELGLERDEIGAMAASERAALRPFLAASAGDALAVGWTVDVVGAVGHYGDIFARHLGADSALGLDRGLNRLWSDGGLHHPMPFR